MSVTKKGRILRKNWPLLALWIVCVLYVLFQGGKTSVMLLVMVSILVGYLLLSGWKRLYKINGSRVLAFDSEHGALKAGDQLHIHLKLEMSSLLPIPFYLVREVLKRHNGNSWSLEDSVVPKLRGTGEMVFQTPPLTRGRYQFDDTEIRVEDIFGLMQHQRHARFPGEFRVLPRTIFIPYWQVMDRNSNLAGAETAMSLSRRETPQINGVRDYVYGDRISRIHWNATAKTGVWKSKEFEHESLPKTVLVLDARKAVYESEEQFELAVSITASLLEYGVRERMNIGLCTLGSNFQIFAPEAIHTDWQRMIHHLVDLDADGVGRAKVRLELRSDFFRPGTVFVYITTSADEELPEVLRWVKVHQMTPYLIDVGDQTVLTEHEEKVKRAGIPGTRGVYVSSLQDLPLAVGGDPRRG